MNKRAPTATPETQPFWDSARVGKLCIQRCSHCTCAYFPPRPFCPTCLSRDTEWFVASGNAKLYSFTINHRPRPDWPPEPHTIAIVELEEGPRMVSNIIGVASKPEALEIDMPLKVEFEKLSDEISIPVFRPVTTLKTTPND